MKVLIKTTAAVITAIAVSAFTFLQLTNRSIDPNYTLKFSTRAVEGTFSGLKGTVIFTPDDLANSKIDVVVDANSINTGNKTKDEHAKGTDWLYTSLFPQIKFTSSSFNKTGNTYSMEGRMELHGVVQTINIPFSYEETNGKGYFAGIFFINRTNFFVNGSGMKASIVGDDIKVEFKVPTSLN